MGWWAGDWVGREDVKQKWCGAEGESQNGKYRYRTMETIEGDEAKLEAFTFILGLLIDGYEEWDTKFNEKNKKEDHYEETWGYSEESPWGMNEVVNDICVIWEVLGSSLDTINCIYKYEKKWCIVKKSISWPLNLRVNITRV